MQQARGSPAGWQASARTAPHQPCLSQRWAAAPVLCNCHPWHGGEPPAPAHPDEGLPQHAQHAAALIQRGPPLQVDALLAARHAGNIHRQQHKAQVAWVGVGWRRRGAEGRGRGRCLQVIRGRLQSAGKGQRNGCPSSKPPIQLLAPASQAHRAASWPPGTPGPAVQRPSAGLQGRAGRRSRPNLRASTEQCALEKPPILKLSMHPLVATLPAQRSLHSQIICRRLLCSRGRRPLKCRLPPVSTLACTWLPTSGAPMTWWQGRCQQSWAWTDCVQQRHRHCHQHLVKMHEGRKASARA